MINRSLARLACRPVEEGDMLMHDWWLALIAAAMGRAVFLDRATIDYRQHGGNVVGAKDPRSAGYVLQKLKGGAVRRSLSDTARQAGAFLACYEQELTPDQRRCWRIMPPRPNGENWPGWPFTGGGVCGSTA